MMTVTDTPSTTRSSTGRGWAYTGAILGGAVSIAANIAHSYVPPNGASATWAPQPGAVIGAIVWPVFLFIAVEILARVGWPDGLPWRLLRFGGIVPVALVAAMVSYRHLSGLLAFYGEDGLTCLLGPVAVDGLMVMATGAILATSHTRTTAPSTTQQATPTIQKATPTTEYPHPTSTIDITQPSRVDTAPAFTATAGTSAPDPQQDPVTVSAVPARPEVPTPGVVASRINGADATSHTGSPVALRPAARSARPRPASDVPSTPALAAPAPDTSVTGPESAQLSLPIVRPDLLASAREIAKQYRAENDGTAITAAKLAARLKVNSAEAAQALAVIGLGPDNPAQPITTANGSPVRSTR